MPYEDPLNLDVHDDHYHPSKVNPKHHHHRRRHPHDNYNRRWWHYRYYYDWWNGDDSWTWIWCWIIFVFLVIMIVVWAVWLPHTSQEEALTASHTAMAIKPEHFSITRNMLKMDDGTYCVESAALPQGVSTRSGAKRVEGRIKMLRAADFEKHTSRDEVPVTGSCSNHLSEGTFWKQPHQVIVDPTNNAGIPRQFFMDAIHSAVDEWQRRLPEPVVSGQDSEGCVDGFDGDAPDGKNEYMMGFIEEPGVLAVTIIWGIFRGPIQDREVIETDMLFNLHFPWGDASSDSGVYDIQGVSAHEHGHALGEGHTNTNGATMFPSAGQGETSKRTLMTCEAAGLCDLYGVSGNCPAGQVGAVSHFVDPGPQSRCGNFALPSTSSSSVPTILLSAACAGLLIAFG